jgi:chromate transporter
MTQPDIRTTTRAFAKIGLLSFGGPAAQISLMHRTLVDENAWLSERQFLNALSFCMLLPGPEAMQLATYSGWRLHGVRGGLIAGTLFVLPGALVIFALAAIYATFGDVPLVQALFLGVKAAVLVIVLEALLKVSKRALKVRAHWFIAALAFAGIFLLALPFPLIIAVAAIYGALFGKNWQTAAPDTAPLTIRPAQSLVTLGKGVAIWAAPFIAITLLTDLPILTDIAAFFSKLAVVTFGGAYAVLAYMAQDVVVNFGWLAAGEMMDGLGLAETTPGPLILVTQFVGFLAGYGAGGIGLAIVAGLLTLWVTFVPCFLWIFLGAPYIEWMSSQVRLTAALSAITAAVVGVILNLSIWFGLHVLFGTVTQIHWGVFTAWIPDMATLNVGVLALTVVCAYLLLRLHISLGWVLCVSAIAGLGIAAI